MCMYRESKFTKKEIDEAERFCRSDRSRKIYAGRALRDLDDGITESYCFNEWLEEEFKRVVWYEGKGKHRIGYCECGAVVPIKKGRNGETVECPACHRKALLRNSKFSSISAKKVVAVLHKDAEGIMQQIFVAYKDSSYEDNHTGKKAVKRFYIEEEQRDFLFDDNQAGVSIHPTRFSHPTKWTAGAGRIHGWGWNAWMAEQCLMSLYPNNVDNILYGTAYQYSELKTANKVSHVNPIWYLREYTHYPVLEMLYKIGLYSVAEEGLEVNRYSYSRYSHNNRNRILYAKTLKELYIYSTADLKYAVENDLDFQDLQAMDFIRKWKIEESERKRALIFAKKVIERSGEDFEYDFISNFGLFRYLTNQIKLFPANYKEDDYSKIFGDYTDYIGACVELEYDVKNTAISKPHDFKKMHDNVMAIQKYNNSHIYDVGVAAAWSNLHQFVDYTDGTLSLIMAKTAEDIIKEGAELSHCVGRYCARVARGESVICFIRKNDEIDKPWYTAELKPDMKFCDIVQCRGFKNEDDEARPLVDKFLRKYVKWFNKREPEGYDEDRLTAIYYKAVRKTDKGEYISIYDGKVKYKIGVETSVKADKNPDKVCVEGMHIASLDFAKQFGRGYTDAVILEIQVNIHDVIIPDAEDQVRCSRYKILREVPYSELGEWGKERMKAVA